VTGCVLSGIACARPAEDGSSHEPAREHGWLCCVPSHLRLASALNVIPDRVDEASSHGYVVRSASTDPVAHLMPAGPVPGQRGGARVHAAPSSQPPLSLDVVDLTSGVNHDARQLLARGVLGLDDDQVGHLSAATILHGWVRDWASIRREGEPMPRVRDMCRWLSDRLDWAAGKHPALDEFAADLLELQRTLDAIAGHLPPRPQPVDRPCPACGSLTVVREPPPAHGPPTEYVVCKSCQRVLTEAEYRDHLKEVIAMKWKTTAETPPIGNVLWLREDVFAQGVTLGMWNGVRFQPLGAIGGEDLQVSYWAPVEYPADPGPAKEDTA
jgi:hypothetical protein